MFFTLTGKEIRDLAKFVGLIVEESDEDEFVFESEVNIEPCPDEGIAEDEGESDPVRYNFVAYFSEYPDQGRVGLGDSIEGG